MSDACQDTRAALRRGDRGDSVQRHLEACADCSRAALEDALGPTPSLDTAALLADVTRQIERDQNTLRRWKSLPTTKRRRWLLWTALLSAGAFGLAAPRPDLAVYPVQHMSLQLALVVTSLTLVGRWTLGSSREPLASDQTLRRGLLWAWTIVLVMSLLPPAHTAHPASLAGTGDAWLTAAATCAGAGTLLSLPTAAVAMLLGRATGASRRTSWLLGAATAALSGNLALLLHCPIVWNTHRLAGHAVVVPIMLVTLWLIDRLTPLSR